MTVKEWEDGARALLWTGPVFWGGAMFIAYYDPMENARACNLMWFLAGVTLVGWVNLMGLYFRHMRARSAK